MTLEKRWRLYSEEIVGRKLTPAGILLRYLRDNAPLMTRAELDQEFHDVIEQCVQATESSIERHSKELFDLFSNDKIFCLSSVPTSILLWSYYAQNHAGLVLRFTDDVPDAATKTAKPVRYVDQFPSLVDDDIFSDMLAGYDVLDRRKILETIAFTKSNHWAHEHEWRIYAGVGRTRGAYEDIPFIPTGLDGVIFG